MLVWPVVSQLHVYQQLIDFLNNYLVHW